jgi:hypothetical protein
MGIATFGWPALNHAVRAPSLSAGSQVGELGPGQLQNDQGSPATAWQTAAGVLTPEAGAWVQFLSVGPSDWRGFCAARTNWTPSAQWRWRVGGPAILDAPAALPTDTAAGADSGAQTTRTGAVSGGTAYTNAAGSAFVRPGNYPAQAGYTYEVAVPIRRVSGSSTAGSAIIAEYLDEAGAVVRSSLPLAAVAQDSDWHVYTHRWVPGRDGGTTIYLVADTGALQYELGPATMGQVPEYDSGLIPAGVAPGYGQAVLVLPQPVRGQLCRLDISDPSNPDGYLNIPLIYAGDAWTPRRNLAWESAPGSDAQLDEVVTRGGQEFPALQYARRRWDIDHKAIGRDEVWPRLAEMIRSAQAGGNVLFVPDPDGSEINREAVYGRLKTTSNITYPYQTLERRAWRGQITERL